MLPNSNFVFFGTPHFAVIILDELKAAGFLPGLIVTAPDKPAGRKLKLTPPLVKLWAQENDSPFLQPEKLDPVFVYNLPARTTGIVQSGGQPTRPNDWDRSVGQATYNLAILAAYGQIIPSNLIKIFPEGILNVHPSLLPKYLKSKG